MSPARKPRNVDAPPPLPDPCNLCGQRRRDHFGKGCPPGAIEAHAFAGAMAASAEREAEERAGREEGPIVDPRRERILAESAALAPGPMGRFLWLDSHCVERGLTPTSRWWLWAMSEFFRSGKRWWFLEVGRGGSKSTTLERLAGSLAMLEERSVPPGQTWEYLFISVGTDDANRRIRGLQAVNEKGFGLGDSADLPENLRQKVTTHPRGHIDLRDMNGNKILLSSIAGTISAVSGPNSIGIIIDEAAKLRDKAVNANPLREIIASIIATIRARQNIYAIVCSSAWTKSGAHYDAIHDPSEGDNEVRHIARIGAPFLAAALEGLEAVALWEELGDVERPPNLEAARAIRAHAAMLTAHSPNVPTWVANEMYGPTPAAAAIALRREVQALPAKLLNGLPRHMVWLREIASVPLDVDDGDGFEGAAELALALMERMGSKYGTMRSQPPAPGQPMRIPGAMPGDARYAGPTGLPLGQGRDWRRKKVL